MDFSLHRLIICTLLTLLLCGTLRADGTLGDFFTPDREPGDGRLAYKEGSKTEGIEFGAQGGHYGMGVIFRGSELPAPYSKDFQNSSIIQIAFGTLKTKLLSQVPQFGSATLIVNEIPKTRTKYRLVVPTNKDASLKEMALLLFTSPSAPADQSDEEKLKGTFFAQSGTITASTVGISTKVVIRSQGKSLSFRKQSLRLIVEAKLATPFNTQETDLRAPSSSPSIGPSARRQKRSPGELPPKA